MPSVLALDLATNVGFAYGEPGAVPRIGSHRLPVTGEDVGAYAIAFDTWLSGLLWQTIKPKAVVFCAPILRNDMQQRLATLRKLYGLTWHTEFLCVRHEIKCFELYEATVRSFFLGKGAKHIRDAQDPKIILKTLKQQVFERCTAIGWNPANDDQSDAAAAWACACARLAPSTAAIHKGPDKWPG